MADLTLSYSKIDTYYNCPLKYKFTYIDKIPRIERPYLSFGTSLHSTVEFIYGKDVPPPPTLEEVIDFYHQNWKSEGYESPKDEKEHFNYGQKIIEDFYNLNVNASDFIPPFAVEQRINVEINNVNIFGYIDRLDKLDEESLELIDYKSGKKPPDKDRLLKNMQLSIYKIAAEKMYDMKVKKQTIYDLRTNTSFSVLQDQEQIEQTLDVIYDVSRGITNQEFEPRKNNLCDYCDYQNICPEFNFDMPNQKEVQLNSLSLDKAEIMEAVDEYGRLKDEIKEREAMIKELREQIIEFCQSNNSYNPHGDKYKATYSVNAKHEYPEEKVKNLLKPLDLWDKVVQMKPKLLEELIDDRNIPRQIAEQIKNLREVKKSPRLNINKRLDD